jgi:hypothetical protein
MDIKRYETKVEVDYTYFSMVHKAVVYVVKFNDNKDIETILLAANHKWREGYLMVVMTNRDINEREARKLADEYVNGYIVCDKCRRKWDGIISFRIDIRGNRYERVVCAYCDPTVFDLVLTFDYQEVARSACRHKHD